MSDRTPAEYWNEEAGPKWVQHSEALDAMLAPFLSAVISHAKLRSTDRVLDIGCGAGALSLEAAKTASQVVGVDVSTPLLELARTRASEQPNVQFHHGDAGQLNSSDFDAFDVAVSRFGVMFFEDPAPAFAAIRGVMGDHPSMIFACWRHPKFNPWATLPMKIVSPLLSSPPPPPDLTAPGPFAFSDRSRLRDVLRDGGWPNVEITTFETPMILPGETPAKAAAFMMEMGPLGRLLAKTDVDLGEVEARLTLELASHINADGRVQSSGSAWIVEAGM